MEGLQWCRERRLEEVLNSTHVANVECSALVAGWLRAAYSGTLSTVVPVSAVRVNLGAGFARAGILNTAVSEQRTYDQNPLNNPLSLE